MNVLQRSVAELLVGFIRYFLYFVEAAAVLILVQVALRRPAARLRFRRLEAAFGQLARRRRLAVFTVGALALAGRAVLLPVMPPRLPAIGDDFGYILSADTFAHGRLTNPPHPLWTYFETPHIIQQPTYSSMYFPAQGLFMAAGQVVTGNPWFGVWLSVGLMSAALCWMLQGWLPPRWALLGGLLAVMRLALFGYWMNSYFGGAVAALGGALVLGALPRIMRTQRVWDSVMLALGLAILATTRAYEGAVLAAPVGLALLMWLCGKNRPPLGVSVVRVVIPMAVLLSMTAAGVGYYCRRVTGSPFLLPQQHQRDMYAVAPYFIWQSPKAEPVYRQAALRGFYAGAEMGHFQWARSLGGWPIATLMKVRDYWLFYLGPVLTLPLVAFPWILRDRRIRLLLVTGAVFLAGLAVSMWFYPHYAAPATGILYVIVLQSMRHLRLWKRPGGALLARGVPVICVLMVCVRLAAQPFSFWMPIDFPMTWCCTRPGGTYRADVVSQLRAWGGKHLVLVEWKPGDNPFEQWVYNEADIDDAQVVWAWETEHPDDLLRYYADRRVWRLRGTWYGPPEFGPYQPNSGR